MVNSYKMFKKNEVFRVFTVFSAEKPHVLYYNIDYHCMQNYGEIIGPSLTFSRERAMIFDFLVTNIPNSVWSYIDLFL